MRLLHLSLLVATGAAAQVVPWTAETSFVPSTLAGDPTFVVAPRADGGVVALIVGTDTAQLGAFTWTADGVVNEVLAVGQVNAADSRGRLVLVSAANNALLLYSLADDAGLTPVAPNFLNVPSPGQVALSQNRDGGFEVWVDTSSQLVAHYAMSPVVDGGFTFTALASITVPERPSGLAVDDRTGRLYVAQPTLGVLAVEPNGTAEFLISIDAGQLGPLVGGIDLFLSADGGALLFSASPTPEEVVVHSISGNRGTFRAALQIGAPDGGGARARLPRFVDVYALPLPGFPRGVLVVHDGTSGNYKLVSLADVHAVFPLPEPFGAASAPFDAGVDAGVVDAGTPADGGTGGGAGGGGGNGISPGPAPGVEPPPGCGCTGGPFAVLPALLLLWWIRRLRSTPIGP